MPPTTLRNFTAVGEPAAVLAAVIAAVRMYRSHYVPPDDVYRDLATRLRHPWTYHARNCLRRVKQQRES